MIVKVRETRLTWKDTGKYHIQYDVFYSTKLSEEIFNKEPRRLAQYPYRCYRTSDKYPWHFCRDFVHVGGKMPMTVLKFIMSEDVNVTTSYQESWHAQGGTKKVIEYVLKSRDKKSTALDKA